MWSSSSPLLLPLLSLASLASLALSAPTTPKPDCNTHPVCIIGAGPAGLAAAGRLKDKGIKAVVFERQEKVGGKCQAWYDDRYVLHRTASHSLYARHQAPLTTLAEASSTRSAPPSSPMPPTPTPLAS